MKYKEGLRKNCIHGYIAKTMMYISIEKENLAKHAKTQRY